MKTYHIIETCLDHNVRFLGTTYRGTPPDLTDEVKVDAGWCSICTTNEHGSSKRWMLTLDDGEQLTTEQIEAKFGVYARGTEGGRRELANLNTKNEMTRRQRLSQL